MRKLILALMVVSVGAGCGGGTKSTVSPPGCGDGTVAGDERCDDGNTEDGDGCSSTCTVESGWQCRLGTSCVEVQCGDGVVTGDERCDDGNTEDGDGCSSTCTVEPGWQCRYGTNCLAVECGDGVVAGDEGCDDGNTDSGDGCSSACQVEPQDADGNGWSCTPGQACVKTVCGDHTVQGNEQCDDGNDRPFDGCYKCQKEPVCNVNGQYGACQNVCGDGLKSPAEDCDDGDNRSGDGCSADCKLEDVPGVTCEVITSALPDAIDVPVIYRDFKGENETGGHPDFEHFHCSYVSTGLVEPSLNADGKPVFAKATTTQPNCGHDPDGSADGFMLTDAAHFAQWYVDTPGVNKTVAGTLRLTRTSTESYEYDSAKTPIPAGSGGFFPLDGNSGGFGLTSDESRDFHFTTEVRYAFTFQGGEELSFSGDDDVWVFINGKLALDLGGLHPRKAGTVTLDEATAEGLGLVPNQVYEISLFHAERHTTASNFWLTLGGFVKARTECVSTCGDGVKAPDEECDDGTTVDDDACTNACKIGRVIAR